MEQFKDLGLCEHVLKVVSNKKFEKPSEIQKKTIPLILEGKDIIAGSATGSGKTLAFGAGIIKNVKKGEGVQGLILTPTRELAEQVAGALEEFAYYKKLEIVPVYGGVSMFHQTKKLVYADIVVATPGRLLDHIQHNSINLRKVDFLVLDEADRMWDMGFKNDVAKIVKVCPKNRQTLLFSATISGELADFAEKYMKSPVEIAVESYVDTSKLKQVYYDVRDDEKFSLLVHFLKKDKTCLSMIFCNTRRNVDFVTNNLKENGIDAQAIHGGMEQNKRTRVLKNFNAEGTRVLVCTDVAARGLDIQGVSHIYNYDLPKDAKDYVHRIGRTARAGAKGVAVNILASRDYNSFSNILKHNSGLVVKREMTPSFEKIYVKFDTPRRGGNFHGRGNRGGNNRVRSPVRNAPRSGSRNTGGQRSRRQDNGGGHRRSRPHNRSEGSDNRSDRGFRGSGRNTRQRRDRR